MRTCSDCKWFNSYYKLCKLELGASGKFKCVFEYTKACKRYKKRQEI